MTMVYGDLLGPKYRGKYLKISALQYDAEKEQYIATISEVGKVPINTENLGLSLTEQEKLNQRLSTMDQWLYTTQSNSVSGPSGKSYDGLISNKLVASPPSYELFPKMTDISTTGLNVTNPERNAKVAWTKRTPVEEELDVFQVKTGAHLEQLAQQLVSNGYVVGPLTEAEPVPRGVVGAPKVWSTLQVDKDTYKVGDWVVRDYDYSKNVETFRLATTDERKTYGLR